MKKSLVALAALALAGVASAQSSVTLFGIVDASVSHYSASGSTVAITNPLTGAITGYGYYPSTSRTVLGNSGESSSRIGFRGTEDLGGGLAASFWLESQLANDNGGAGGSIGFNNGTNAGTGLFNRRSTVSLSGGFGEIRLGRDYNPTFWNDTVFDPFGTVGVGTNMVSVLGGSAFKATRAGYNSFGYTSLGDLNYVRTSNSIGYFLPSNLGGFYGQLQYGIAEGLSTSGVPTLSTKGPWSWAMSGLRGSKASGKRASTAPSAGLQSPFVAAKYKRREVLPATGRGMFNVIATSTFLSVRDTVVLRSSMRSPNSPKKASPQSSAEVYSCPRGMAVRVPGPPP